MLPAEAPSVTGFFFLLSREKKVILPIIKALLRSHLDFFPYF